MSESSQTIGALAAALAAAQGKITGARKDSANPFFKSKYADLAACWDACRVPLSENGLAVIQTLSEGERGPVITTTLAHSSGEWIRSRITMTPKDSGPQALGSCITYGRRYALAAMVGLAQVDDDANAAEGKGKLLNGLPNIDPRGEAYKDEDQDLAKEYAGRFREALDSGVEGRLRELHTECNLKPDFYIAVSTHLSPKERNQIKAILRGNHQ